MSNGVQNGQATKVYASIGSEAPVVPSDTDKQPEFKSLWITTVGDITVSRDGGITTYTYPAATLDLGEFNLGAPCWIMSTGTTAVMARLSW